MLLAGRRNKSTSPTFLCRSARGPSPNLFQVGLGLGVVTSIDADDLDYLQIDDSLVDQAVQALASAAECRLKIVVAGSCTGGLIACLLNEAPGAAEFFEGGYVVYTAGQKQQALGIDQQVILRCGTVSSVVTRLLAEAALAHSNADIAVAVTCIAGPEPDEKGNPVGLVYLAGVRSGADSECLELNLGDIGRAAIRRIATEEALGLIISLCREAQTASPRRR